jgi:hypothetical protein
LHELGRIVREVSAIAVSLCLFLGALVLSVAGCEDGGHIRVPIGTATVEATSKAFTATDPIITSATMILGPLGIYGDVPPSPPGPSAAFIQLSDTPVSATAILGPAESVQLEGPEPGLYSGVQLDFHQVTLTGTWRGTQLMLHPDRHGPPINLRASTVQELGPEENVTFIVTIDPNTWFTDDLLDSAMIVDGMIVCDDDNNPTVAAQLAANIQAGLSLP